MSLLERFKQAESVFLVHFFTFIIPKHSLHQHVKIHRHRNALGLELDITHVVCGLQGCHETSPEKISHQVFIGCRISEQQNFYSGCSDFNGSGGFFTSTGDSSSWGEEKITRFLIVLIYVNEFPLSGMRFYLRVWIVVFARQAHVGHQSFFLRGSVSEGHPGSPVEIRF